MSLLARLAAIVPVARYEVEGESMLPDVTPGERVLVHTAAYKKRDPAPGDLVVLHDPRERTRLLIKRIEAREGDRWKVTGANPRASTDSRTFGPVAQEQIVGRVLFRY
jgi:nickel-type superoxide dismutase maturation protease